jgi:hypothetical protein
VKLTAELEKPFYAAVDPMVQRLIRAGVRPNTITTIGTGLVLLSAIVYARARAEGLGLDCKVGIAQRAERVLGLGLASLIFGAGRHALLLESIVGLLAIASTITVVQRFVYVHQHAGKVDEALHAEEAKQAEELTIPAELKLPPEPKRPALDPLAKGS